MQTTQAQSYSFPSTTQRNAWLQETGPEEVAGEPQREERSCAPASCLATSNQSLPSLRPEQKLHRLGSHVHTALTQFQFGTLCPHWYWLVPLLCRTVSPGPTSLLIGIDSAQCRAQRDQRRMNRSSGEKGLGNSNSHSL